jgi:hypothetical protein
VRLEVLAAAVFLACLLAGMYVYEKLVKRQYEIAREAWEADDQPPGFAWAPPGNSTTRSWVRSRAMWHLTWSSPEWIRSDLEAGRMQRRLRQLTFVQLVAWGIGMVSMLLGSTRQ